MMASASTRSAGLLWPTLAALAALGVLLGLGTWQLQRKAWKDGLQRQIDERAAAAPQVATSGDVLAKLPEYTRVTVRGVFRHEGERHLWSPDPRMGSGFLVFTPLTLADGSTLMVNRGFVPDALRDPAKRAEGQLAGEVGVTGLLRAPEMQAAFVPANEPARNLWYWRDLPAMAGAAPRLVPMLLDAGVEPANPGGWPKGGTTAMRLPNKHLEYAITWYGIALTLIGVYAAFVVGRLKAAYGAGPQD
jgi:surfeit locus 1 family protein